MLFGIFTFRIFTVTLVNFCQLTLEILKELNPGSAMALFDLSFDLQICLIFQSLIRIEIIFY